MMQKVSVGRRGFETKYFEEIFSCIYVYVLLVEYMQD